MHAGVENIFFYDFLKLEVEIYSFKLEDILPILDS